MAETIGATITLIALALIFIMVSSTVVDAITERRIRKIKSPEPVRFLEPSWPPVWKYRIEKVRSKYLRAEPQNVYRKIGRKK